MSSGGKGGGSKSVVVGYRYFMGIQIALCIGEVDEVSQIIVGEREAWAGSVTSNTTININRPTLFGGDSREGGVVGDVDILLGGANQGRNGYLASFQGPTCPAYRGIVSLVFKRFMWSSGNPYFKSPWVKLKRILKGWHNDVVWNSSLAAIGPYDMNPAHIIYQCLTDPNFAMGYSASDIDETSFTYAAQALHDEGFGLSIEWDVQSPIEDFIKNILSHINATLSLDLRTGKFTLRLIRANYDVNTLLELNETNVIELRSFQRLVLGDGANEVVVMYTDREGRSVPIAVQNIANINAQGRVVSTTKNYEGIRDAGLAARVAMRDLKILTSALAQVTVTCNRSAWDKEIGEVVALSWSDLGMTKVPFRIVDIQKGTLTASTITVKLVEDIFGLPTSGYTSSQPNQWVDNVVPPVAVDAGRAVEATYWDVVRNLTLANQANLIDEFGFGVFLACRGATQSPFNFVLSASANDVNYSDVATGHFLPTGLLANPLDKMSTSIVLSGAYDLEDTVLSWEGGYAYIGNECVSVEGIDPTTGAATIGRGILDTVPLSHAAGTRVFFVGPGAAYDPTERTAGEIVYYRPRPATGIGTLDLQDAEPDILTFANRATRPYPPGGFKVNGAYYPASIGGPSITLSWSHRDRVAQTVSMVPFTEASIGPEPGVTYRVRAYNGETLLATYDLSGGATSWTYPTSDDIAHGSLSVIRFDLVSVRDGVESLYAQSHVVNRLVVTGGTFIEGPPAKPTLIASKGTFSIMLDWMFGDGRSNIESTEIWVSESPVFSEGTVLRYEDYPVQSYTHELTEVGAHRWYWVRVNDTAGQLSEWSDVAYARAGFAAGVQTVDALPATPTPGGEVLRLSTDGKLYLWNGTDWQTGVLAGDIIGEIAATTLVAGSVDSAALAENAVTETKIEDNAITSGKIAANSVVAAKIAALAVTADKIAANAISADKIAANAITADKLNANIVTADKIAANAVTVDKIAASAVTSDKISVTNLAAISANLGAITGGSLNIGGKFIVDSSGNVVVKSADSGARVETRNNVIKVYDANGVIRVKIGDLSA